MINNREPSYPIQFWNGGMTSRRGEIISSHMVLRELLCAVVVESDNHPKTTMMNIVKRLVQ